jgi:hypothetical protein
MSKSTSESGIVLLAADLEIGSFREYHQALGEFISVFSEVETNLISAFWHLAGVKPPIAQAVLTGHKVEGVIGLINRLADAEDWSEARKAAFKKFSDQLGLINKLRNDILHNGSNWTSSQTWTVTNRHSAHVPSRIRSYPVTTALLRSARSDLQKIEGDLVLFTWGNLMEPHVRETFEQGALHAWQYKPPPGFETAQKNQKTPRKLPSQPKASRASRRREAMRKYQT